MSDTTSYDRSAVRIRKVFDEELGAYFRGLREKRGWKFLGTVRRAQSRGLTTITKNTLGGIESGQTKNADPELLRELAILYGESYEHFALLVFQRRFAIAVDARSVPDSAALLLRSADSVPADTGQNSSPHQQESARSAHADQALSPLPTPQKIDIGKLVAGEVDEAKRLDYERLKVQIGRARQVDHAESARIARIILKTRRRLVEATADLDAVTEALGRQAATARLRGPRLPGMDRGDDRRASGRSSRGGQS